MTTSSIDIKNLTKQKPHQLPFEKIKNEVLGKKYELSLTFIGEKRSKKFNKQYRGKDKPASILSFPLEKKMGEIFITLTEIPKKTKELQMNKRDTLAYIFIHGLLHLKGFEHGEKMEKEEYKFRHFFNNSKAKNIH